ncbi:MAG: hypothetical protein LBE12_06245, partial [Planctomycetaceae bacterium]|nr:hypothetical protein [Planctomycetaceae bacterium]
MSKNHSLLKKITKIIFGNTVSKIPKQRTCRKRMFGFESLENRELLSVSPLLPGLFSSYQSSFEQNTFAYVDDNSAVKTNHTDYTVESAERSETVTAMSFQTEEGEMMDCCTNNMGTITATVEITNLGETTATGLGTQGIVHIERSNDDDCGIYSNVTVTYRLSGTATPGSDYSAASSLSYYEDEDGNYYYEGTFGISANTATYDFPIYVLNDGIVESSETIIFTLVSAEVEYCAEYTVTGSASFTIKDDDKWKVSVVTTDGTATERLSDVAQDYGEFKFVRTFSGEDEDDEGTGDQSYG